MNLGNVLGSFVPRRGSGSTTSDFGSASPIPWRHNVEPALNSFHLEEAFEPRRLGDKSRYGIYQSGIFVGGVAFGEWET